MNKNSNRPLTSEELYSLLSKLGVKLNVSEEKKEEFVEIFNKFDRVFGNPLDKQSMIDLTWLLLNMQVDIWNDRNRRIIDKAIYNKQDLGEQNLSVVKEIDVKEFDVDNFGLNIYIKKMMLDLGFKPHCVGFEVFKDCVLYLLNTEEVPSWTKITYPALGKKHNLKAHQVERVIRVMINVACQNHYDNEICKYVYGVKEHVTNAECLCSVVDYVKLNYNDEVIKQYFSKKDAIECDNSLERVVSVALNQLGIFPKIKGYSYLRDAILYVLANGCNISWLDLYSCIGSKYFISGNKVERCIRHAISNSREKYEKYTTLEFKVEDASEIEKFVYQYGCTYMSSEFISLIAEYIRLNYEKSFWESYNHDSSNVSVIKRLRKK